MIIDYPTIEVSKLKVGQKAFTKDEQEVWLDKVQKGLSFWSTKEDQIRKLESIIWGAVYILLFTCGVMAIVFEEPVSKGNMTVFLACLALTVALFLFLMFSVGSKKDSISEIVESLEGMRRLLLPVEPEFVDWSELRNHLLDDNSVQGQYLCQVRDQGRSLTYLELESIELTLAIETQNERQRANDTDYNQIICGLTC